MRNLVVSLGVVLAFAIGTFAALSALKVQKEIATSASGIFLGAVPYVHKTIERKSKKALPVYSPGVVVSLESFTMPSTVVIMYGLFLGLAITQGAGAVAGVIAGITSILSGADVPFALVALLLLPVQLVLGYLVGKWIGIKSKSRGAWLVVAVFAVIVAAEHALRLLISAPEFAKVFLAQRTTTLVVGQWLGATALWSAIGLLGFWRGRRVRMLRYAEYLLKKLPLHTRATVLELMRDEVARSSTEPRRDGAEVSPAPVSAM